MCAQSNNDSGIKDVENKQTFNRRTFIKTAGVTIAGMTLPISNVLANTTR